MQRFPGIGQSGFLSLGKTDPAIGCLEPVFIEEQSSRRNIWKYWNFTCRRKPLPMSIIVTSRHVNQTWPCFQ